MPYAADNWLGTSHRPGSVSISQEAYVLALQHITTGGHVAVEGGAVVLLDPPAPPEPPEPPELTLEQTKVLRASQINDAAQSEADAVAGHYPLFERETWRDQEAEALAWQADNQAPTPTLDIIALERDITVAALVPLVLDNAAAFRAMAAQLAGKRQRLRDEIIAAETVDEVLAIEW